MQYLFELYYNYSVYISKNSASRKRLTLRSEAEKTYNTDANGFTALIFPRK